MDKMEPIYTMEYYSTMKNKMSLARKWVELEVIVLSNSGQTQRDKYVFFHMQNLDLKKT
jgi:hypothetical protein